MDRETAHKKFHSQRRGAKARGIGWELTFDQWLAWWGEDLDRRGQSPSSLQMQRVADAGPYAIGNIRKGTPRTNMQTRGKMQRKRQADRALWHLERQRDADLGVSESPDDQDPDEMYAPHQHYAPNIWEPKY